MSYFSTIELKEITINDIDNSYQLNYIQANKIGTVLLYDTLIKRYLFCSDNDGLKLSSSIMKLFNNILLGVVVNQYDDLSVDIMMTDFLLAEPLGTLGLYITRNTSDADKVKAIRAYSRDEFLKYLKIFANKCPDYKDIMSLNVSMPQVGELLFVQNNYPQIFETVRKCMDNKVYNSFTNRLFNNYIYAIHDKKIYLVKLSLNPDEEKADVILPDLNPSEFICVFRHVNINDNIMNNDDEFEIIIDEQ